jgi:hypothetical protein
MTPMKLKSFQAWILVDGKEVNQYGLETQENKMTCWIPSEAGKVCLLLGLSLDRIVRVYSQGLRRISQ